MAERPAVGDRVLVTGGGSKSAITVGRIVEMRGEELLISWHGASPSWINCKGEFSAPHDERRVRILGFLKPSEMGPFYMDMDTDMDDIDI